MGLKWLACALLVIGCFMPSDAQARWRSQQCRFQSLEPARWTEREEQRTAWCLQAKWAVPGGYTKLYDVIDCESGWSRFAYNPGGPYVGLAQHHLASWAGRVAAYAPRHWELRPGWRNSRTQLVVTVRMVRAVGWGPWSCA